MTRYHKKIKHRLNHYGRKKEHSQLISKIMVEKKRKCKVEKQPYGRKKEDSKLKIKLMVERKNIQNMKSKVISKVQIKYISQSSSAMAKVDAK